MRCHCFINYQKKGSLETDGLVDKAASVKTRSLERNKNLSSFTLTSRSGSFASPYFAVNVVADLGKSEGGFFLFVQLSLSRGQNHHFSMLTILQRICHILL